MNTLSRIPVPLLSWYEQNHRILPWRDPIVPYHTWVSEIMLQQTRVDAVIEYYHRFLSVLPTIADLAAADEQLLLKLWEGLGYYNRVRNLQKAAKVVVEQYGGELPADYAALQKLSGIGKYTAGAIASIAFNLPVPAVDGNVLRVISRAIGSFDNISRPQTKARMELELESLMQTPPAVNQTGDFVQALMELGALICVPNGAPKCESCPLNSFCIAARDGLTDQIPVKDEKKARTIVPKTMFVLFDGKCYALNKRADKGLLASLWELPNVDEKLKKSELVQTLQSWNLCPQTIETLGSAKHIFSHIEWKMNGYLIQVTPESAVLSPFTWVTPQQLEAEFALPSAFDAYRPFIR